MKQIFTFWIALIFCTFFTTSSFSQDLFNILELHYCEIRDLEVDSEGNTIIAAMSLHGSLSIENKEVDMLYGGYTNRYYNIFVAKISPNNELLWISRGKTATINFDDDDERITIYLHIDIDRFDNIYTLVSKSSYRGRYREEIIWEDETFEIHNNLLFKLNSKGVVKWNKSWYAYNHPTLIRQFYQNYISRGSLLSVNQNGDILVASEVRPSGRQTILDNDTIVVTHAGNNHTNIRWADPAMLLLRFDNNGKFKFHRSAVIEPYGKDIDQPEYVTFKDIQIDKEGGFSVLAQINAHAFFSTGESIEETNKESEVYLLKYDRFGGNMTYDKSYALTSKANLEINGSNVHINDFEKLRIGDEYSISQRKVNENGQLISDIQTLFKSENAKVFLHSNIITDNTDASYFMLKVIPNNSNKKASIYLDVQYDMESQPEPKKGYGYYFFVKMEGGKVQSSSLYDTIYEDNYWYHKRSPELIQIRKDNKGSIYFHDSYLPNAVILGRNMPKNIRHPNSGRTSCFIATLDSKYIILSNKEELLQSKYVNVYPNPSTSIINIELDDDLEVSEVIITNNLGMELQKTKITNSNKIMLDLENLSNGIYFVKIISQKGIFYKKVVLKK